MKFFVAKRLTVVLAATALWACAPSIPADLYTLSTTIPSTVGNSDPTIGPVIGVGPIVLPQYLDRPQIVSRGDGNRLMLADFASWGEPLQSMVERVLVEDIGRLLRTNNVVVLPQRLDMPLDARVEIEVFRFEAETNGRVVLEARWRIIEGDRRDQEIFRSQRTSLNTQVEDATDYSAVALAMSELVGRLSQEIATALIAVPKA